MIIHSPYPDITIPSQSLAAFVLDRARRHGDKPAYIDGLTGQTMSFREFVQAVEQTAAGLKDLGLGQGDVCMIHSPNCLDWPVAYYAILALGGVVTPASPLAKSGELAAQMKDSGATWLFTAQMVLQPALAAAEQAVIDHIIVFGDPAAAPDDLIAFAELATGAAIQPLDTIDVNDLALLPYSSGTSGLPKGVMLTHRNLVANVLQVEAMDLFEPVSRSLGVLPFFHVLGLTLFINLMPSLGLPVVVLPKFDLEWFLLAIQTHQVTHAFAVPPIVLALARHRLVDQYDLSSLVAIGSSAAPLEEDIARACAERLDCWVGQGFGMSELGAACITPLVIDNPAAAGLPIPSTEFRIVGLSIGSNSGPNEPGEIWIRGPQVMKGYLNQPEATAETITVDGWLKTGDVGFVDEDGYIYVTDRVKELIKYKGHQVAPTELEEVLLTHPAIIDAAVIGAPDQEAGEIPKAFIVRGGEVTGDEIMVYVAERIAPYKKVRAVEFVDEVPRSVTGKILRRVLVERERDLITA